MSGAFANSRSGWPGSFGFVQTSGLDKFDHGFQGELALTSQRLGGLTWVRLSLCIARLQAT